MAPILEHRVPHPKAWHHRSRNFWLSAIFQRASAFNISSWRRDNYADIQQDHDFIAPISGTDQLFAFDDQSLRDVAGPWWFFLGPVCQTRPKLNASVNLRIEYRTRY